MKLSMDQVDLTQVGLIWVTRYPRAMLDRLAEMGVAFYAQPSEESNAPLIGLGKHVCWAAAHSYYACTYQPGPPSEHDLPLALLWAVTRYWSLLQVCYCRMVTVCMMTCRCGTARAVATIMQGKG